MNIRNTIIPSSHVTQVHFFKFAFPKTEVLNIETPRFQGISRVKVQQKLQGSKGI